MTVIVIPDPAKGPGYALIRVPGAARAADGSFRIFRPPGWPEPNLGPSGWQGSEALLPPDEMRPDGADLLLGVGPAICGRLDEATYYFALPAIGLNEPVAWPAIDEPHGGFENSFAPAAVARPAPQPVLSGTATTQPADDATIVRRPSPLILEPPPDPVRHEPAPKPRGMPAPPPPPPVEEFGTKPLMIGAMVFVLVAGPVGAWWLLHGPALPPAVIQRDQAAIDPPSNQRIEQQPTPTPTPGPDLDTMSIGNLVARNDPAAMLDQARKRLGSNPQDSILLLEASGEDRHHGPALTLLAQLYDPNKPRRGGIPADARQAAKYYRDAQRNQDDSAAADRAALRRTVQARREAGDLNAKLIEQDYWP